MFETTERFKHQEDSRSTHASAFSGWLATKTRENDVRKALLLGASEQLPASIDGDLNGPHRAIIVVVDDEPHIAITLSEILARRGYRTVWFTEPVAALALMQAHRPDVLLTDILRRIPWTHDGLQPATSIFESPETGSATQDGMPLLCGKH